MVFYDLEIISDLLRCFKVKTALISNGNDDDLIKHLLKCDVDLTAFDLNTQLSYDGVTFIHDFPLKKMRELSFDAVFINDDPNWYTVYNELKLMVNKGEFPLVLICNNRFPNKRRDAYFNPELIPVEFRHEYSKSIPIQYEGNQITVEDEIYHANVENSSRNGVLTAIEDFLREYSHVEVLDINLIPEITILYPKSTISNIRLDKFKERIKNKEITDFSFSDNIIVNQILIQSNLDNNGSSDINQLANLKLELSKKESMIRDYEKKIRLHDNEIRYKNSKIISVESNLNHKGVQIKDLESKLINKDAEINDLRSQVESTNVELNNITEGYESKLINKDAEINDLRGQVESTNVELNNITEGYESKLINKDAEINDLRVQVESSKKESDNLNNEAEYLRKVNVRQLGMMETKEYCIKCFKEEISNNHIEIQFLKNNSLFKRIIFPLSYLYLIFNSKHDEIFINIKLFKILNNSECFDIGFYLNKYPDIRTSKWLKFFSPELHYICRGFDEKRVFNKKFFNNNSKQELLNYILNCETEY